MNNFFVSLFSIFLLLNAFTNYAQEHFYLKSAMSRPIIFFINGQEYTIDSNYQKIPTAFPYFDTVQFHSSDPERMRILYNFQKDSSYTISWACCATVDVYPSYKTDYDSLTIWDFEKDHQKITQLLLDRPRFILSGKETSDSNLYAWCLDYACFPKVAKINDSVVDYGIANKCFFWSNITPIEFFTGTIEKNQFSEDTFPDSYYNYVSKATVFVRFFDNKKYHVMYNDKDKTINVKQE